MKIDALRAADILSRCGASPDVDYHALHSRSVDRLIEEADAYGYEKPADAPGSRARMFFEYLVQIIQEDRD